MQILESEGEEAAKVYMRSVSSKVDPKNLPGGAFKDKDFAKKAQLLSAKARKRNGKNKDKGKRQAVQPMGETEGQVDVSEVWEEI